MALFPGVPFAAGMTCQVREASGFSSDQLDGNVLNEVEIGRFALAATLTTTSLKLLEALAAPDKAQGLFNLHKQKELS